MDIKVPELGESITEATVASWLKKEGESVEIDEPIVELETDKITMEVGAPTAGVISSIKVKEGQTVAVGEVLGSVDADGKALEKPSKEEAEKEPEAEQEEPEEDTKAAEPKAAEKSESKPSEGDKIMSPAARKIAAEKNIDPSKMQGTGKDGRITKEDVSGPVSYTHLTLPTIYSV